MPVYNYLKKVAVIGSGPIIIGQAAEFDYAGSQACRSLREEGLEVILINSNPATIMTDSNMADKVYLEPLTLEVTTKILEREKPQGLLPTLGGQVGLNLAKELAKEGTLSRLNIKLLGTSLDTIEKAEDREKFKQCMEDIGEPIPPSVIVENVEDAESFAHTMGFPLIVRPAYTMGGTGGGMVYNNEELRSTVVRGLKHSIIGQALIEKSVAGWKEIEFEVIRDGDDNCIIICSMENIDPAGVHTGDSFVVAPALTLGPPEFNLLRDASLRIIRALGVEGGCNIQFALNPHSMEYIVIEVNPRVSRSSALASKATGYPIARIASKIAIGITLPEITNTMTGIKSSCFEPVIDYCVVKAPRWPFDKFSLARRNLGTQMKATGEAMSIGRNLETALMKAIRSLEIGQSTLCLPGIENISDTEINRRLVEPDDERLFILAEALRRGVTPEDINNLCGIDKFFIYCINNIVKVEKELKKLKDTNKQFLPGKKSQKTSGKIDINMALKSSLFIKEPETVEILQKAIETGYSVEGLVELTGIEAGIIEATISNHHLNPVYKKVDTCAGEHEAITSYFYSATGQENEFIPSSGRKVVVLGSGPIRIGQGVEFDYCSVHAAWALEEEGLESIIINNNPETVSTDYDTSTRLYFEPLTPSDVMNIIKGEDPEGVIVQFGGQTAINLAEGLRDNGVPILGTSVDSIDKAEDREKFDIIMEDVGLKRPPGKACYSLEQALETASKVGFPVVVRPSYVLGGRAMEIVYNEKELQEYMETAVKVSPKHPVLVDRYMNGLELEVDAVFDGKDILIPGIMEHVERAGVHSGDSIAVFPSRSLSPEMEAEVVEATRLLATALEVRGMVNVQYVVFEGGLYVLEVNPRSSRTVPFISKIMAIPLVNLAVKVSLGKSLKDLGYKLGLYPPPDFIAVKAPVFSFAKLLDLDTVLGPEMKSTGEVMGLDRELAPAMLKALAAAGFSLPPGGTVLATIADKDKEEALPILRGFDELGYIIKATAGTAAFLSENGVSVERVNKVREGSPHILDQLRGGEVNLVINTLTRGKAPERDGFRIRRAAAEYGVFCFTSLDTAGEVQKALRDLREGKELMHISLQEYLEGVKTREQ